MYSASTLIVLNRSTLALVNLRLDTDIVKK